AGGDGLARLTRRGQRMAERERGYLAAARIQVGIGSDAQSVGLLLDGSDNGAFGLDFSPSLENDHLQPEAAHRGLRLLDVIPRETRIVRIHKDRNPGRGGKELTQQLQPLGNKFGSDKSDSRDVSLRTTEAGHETRGHRVGGRHEHDWGSSSLPPSPPAQRRPARPY